jgi:hypothetical protein
MKILNKEDKRRIVQALNKMIESKREYVKKSCTHQNGTLNFAGEVETNEIKEFERLMGELVNMKDLRQSKEVWI